MNYKALGLAAAVALAAPLSAQAVTTLVPGGTFDILSDDEFVFELTSGVNAMNQPIPLGLVDLAFTFTLTPPPNKISAIAFQATISTGAQLPQMNFASSDLVYTAGSGFAGATISDASIVQFGGSFLATLTTVFNVSNGLTQVLNIGFNAPVGFTQISLQVQPIPLPASVLLLLSAVAGLGFATRRKAA